MTVKWDMIQDKQKPIILNCSTTKKSYVIEIFI